jgi:hypothetical protein
VKIFFPISIAGGCRHLSGVTMAAEEQELSPKRTRPRPAPLLVGEINHPASFHHVSSISSASPSHSDDLNVLWLAL